MARLNMPDMDGLVGKRVKAGLKNGAAVIGTLRSYDSFANIVLADCDNGLGEGVVRGDSIEKITLVGGTQP
ncbi:small nuclear ribonucleoprotein G [Pancytospora philotis]|nr:small nuclear ribonucleoprotein G [Pancytospora philotis]